MRAIEKRHPILCTTAYISLLHRFLVWKMPLQCSNTSCTLWCPPLNGSLLWYIMTMFSLFSRHHRDIWPAQNGFDTSQRSGRSAVTWEKMSFTSIIEYYGHSNELGWPEVAIYAAEIICELKLPARVAELHLFLGLCNVFTRIFPKFAGTASYLSKQLKKSQAKDLTDVNE